MVDLEKWRDVVGYEAYFKVSESGKIFSKRSSRNLRLTPLKSDYLSFATKLGGRDSKAICFRVHRLVAEAFLGKPSNNLIEICSSQGYGKVLVRHMDDEKTNNHYSNLCWGTHQDNSDDYVRCGKSAETGRKVSGLGHWSRALSKDEIMQIKDRYIKGSYLHGGRALAKEYCVDHCTIYRAVKY